MTRGLLVALFALIAFIGILIALASAISQAIFQ